jgi:hypothetical protein
VAVSPHGCWDSAAPTVPESAWLTRSNQVSEAEERFLMPVRRPKQLCHGTQAFDEQSPT